MLTTNFLESDGTNLSSKIEASDLDGMSMVFIMAFPFGCPGAPIENAIPASGVTSPGDSIWALFCSQHDWEIAQWVKTEYLTLSAFSRLLAIPEVWFIEISTYHNANTRYRLLTGLSYCIAP